MTTPEHPTIHEITSEMKKPQDIAEPRRANPHNFLRTKEQLEAYAAWKREISPLVCALVESAMMGQSARIDTDALPLMQEAYTVVQTLLENPSASADDVVSDPRVKNILFALQKLETKKEDTFVNLYDVLASPTIGFQSKLAYTRDRLLPRLDWLAVQAKEERNRMVEQTTDIHISPDEEHDSYEVRRGPEPEKSEGMPEYVTAMTYPYFGGHYASVAHDSYDPATCRWSRSERRYRELPAQSLDEEKKRIYRGAVLAGKSVAIGRSDNWQGGPWTADKTSIRWLGDEQPASWNVVHDQDVVILLSVEGDVDTAYQFDMNIGPAPDAIVPDPPEGEPKHVPESFPQELLDKVDTIMRENIPVAVKIKRITAFIRNHLEYSLDPSLEAVYKSDTSQYFHKMWELKQAKCDEANTLAARALQKHGFHIRFVGEHSVRTKSPEGWTLLHDGNLHGWFWAYDGEKQQWLRLDATPKGDPNVDEDEQEAELGEGDFGEQEQGLMSEEELQKTLDDIIKKEQKQEEREHPEIVFAREANCSPEEAKQVLDKIKELRERYARVLKDAQKQWQGLVQKNMRERIVDRGPVPLSQADDIDEDELVSGYIELKAGEQDPHIGMKEVVKQKKEEWFGGYEVYIAADMSGSMNENIDGVIKRESQRDMVFLLIDSCMSAAVHSRKKNKNLKSPMPVKICLTVFGATTEVVLPITDQWGPSEQIRVYRALDAGAGGATPDDEALAMIAQQIADARRQEEQMIKALPKKKRDGMKKNHWCMRRIVLAVADGGSGNAVAVRQQVDALRKQDITVDLFLIADEKDENLHTATQVAYGNVTPTSNPDTLGEKSLGIVTQRLREGYEKT